MRPQRQIRVAALANVDANRLRAIVQVLVAVTTTLKRPSCQRNDQRQTRAMLNLRFMPRMLRHSRLSARPASPPATRRTHKS